jgi:hypothetical protein
MIKMNRCGFNAARLTTGAHQRLNSEPNGNKPTSSQQLKKFDAAQNSQETNFLETFSTFFGLPNLSALFSQKEDTNDAVETWLQTTRNEYILKGPVIAEEHAQLQAEAPVIPKEHVQLQAKTPDVLPDPRYAEDINEGL